jgi:undecaprenyl-diphosphatase
MWPNTLVGQYPWLDSLAVLITHYGIFFLLLCVLFARDRRLLIHAGLTFAIAILADDIINALWFSPRPFTVDASTLIVAGLPDSSFPSGHTLRSFALAMPILLRGYRWLGIVALAIAVLVSVSRVYVGVHWWSDILGGAAISIGAAYAVRYFLERKR